jgi:hypothetical protein
MMQVRAWGGKRVGGARSTLQPCMCLPFACQKLLVTLFVTACLPGVGVTVAALPPPDPQTASAWCGRPGCCST